MNDSSKEELSYQEILSTLTRPPSTNLVAYIHQRVRYLVDNNSAFLENLPIKPLFLLIRPYICNKEQEIRTTALRLYRYLCQTPEHFECFKSIKIEHYLIRSFEVDGKNQERIEACKLIRRWLELSPWTYTKGLCSALVALSEADNDEFKEFGIEALRLLSIHNAELVAVSGGIKCLVSALLDFKCSLELSENIVYTLCYLLNEPQTRRYLKNGKELMRIFAVFTESSSVFLSESDLEVQLRLAKRAIVLMCRSWSGLICLSAYGLKHIIEILLHPGLSSIKEAILDTFTEMLGVSIEFSPGGFNLLHNYYAVLLKILLNYNLHPALTILSIDLNSRVSEKSRKLLKIITKLSSQLLPDSPICPISLNSGSEGKLLELISEVDRSCRRSLDVNTESIFSLASNSNFSDHSGLLASNNSLSKEILTNYKSSTIDDNNFFTLLSQSKTNKDPQSWDWPVIFELLTGPISVSDRIQHAETLKFLKNLLMFFTPSKNCFTYLAWNPKNFLISKTGFVLIKLLLPSKTCRKLLMTSFTESFFVSRKSFVEELLNFIDEEIRRSEGVDTGNYRVLSAENLVNTMSREYFKFLALLINDRAGRKMLESFHFHSKVLKISEIEHLSSVLLPALDYKEQLPQQFLLYCLQSSKKLIKLKALQQIQVIFRAGLFDVTWAIWSIVNFLHSDDPDILRFSLNILNDICSFKENLTTLIQTRPQSLLRHGKLGKAILLKFLSTLSGISYLNEIESFDKELEDWDQELNIDYAKTLEEQIEQSLKSKNSSYGLTAHVPKVFQGYNRLQLSWLSILPLLMLIEFGSKKLTVDVLLEAQKHSLNIVACLSNCTVVKDEVFSVCLKLGNFYIDSRGNESNEGYWVKCKFDSKKNSEDSNSIEIENEGVIFCFDQSTKNPNLTAVKYRVKLIPQGVSSLEAPKHYFSELTKTKPGFSKLVQSKILEKYTQNIMGDYSILEKRAWMWAIGHTGTTNQGASYLYRIGAVEKLIKIAETCEILSLRGTAIQTLSLISRSFAGRQILIENHWVCRSENQDICISLPADPRVLLGLNADDEVFYTRSCEMIEHVIDGIKLSELEKEIYYHLCRLSGCADRSESESFLKNLRVNAPMSYQSLPLFHAVMVTLSGFTFKLAARRVVHKLLERVYRIENIQEIDFYVYPN